MRGLMLTVGPPVSCSRSRAVLAVWSLCELSGAPRNVEHGVPGVGRQAVYSSETDRSRGAVLSGLERKIDRTDARIAEPPSATSPAIKASPARPIGVGSVVVRG